MIPRLLSSLLALILAFGAAGQEASRPMEIRVPGSAAVARLWSEVGAAGDREHFYQISLDGRTFSRVKHTDYDLRLRFERFDPLERAADVPSILSASAANHLMIVQYWTQGIEDYRRLIARLGGEIRLTLANHANVVEMDPATTAVVRRLPFVRSVSPFHPAFKLEEELLAAVAADERGPLKVNLLTTRRSGHAPVIDWIERRGGAIDHVSEPTYLMTATIRHEDVPRLAALDSVQWVERWQAPANDMGIARRFHGARWVGNNLNYFGQGVRVEVMDSGCDELHPDLPSLVKHNVNTPSDHGTCTAGIVAGRGFGEPDAQGVMPQASLVIADYDSPYAGGSRYGHSGQLVNPGFPLQCVIQTNSWGSGLTTAYNAKSQDMDLILFDFQKLSITQSQSNQATQSSRPEAWAKNVISVGGINHLSTVSSDDDFWTDASIGPAADNRIKPDLASFYDEIHTVDRPGLLGYSSTNYFPHFGGTSGATPLVAGLLGLIYEMWDDELFGNSAPGNSVFANAPNNTTAKALLINTAKQWNFTGTAHNLTRMHQGWGYPELRFIAGHAGRDEVFVVDESDVLADQESTLYRVCVPVGATELRVTMVYNDPPGTVSSTQHRINDLDLTVESPSGATYFGNIGLYTQTTSASGGLNHDAKNTVEQVLLEDPEPGPWRVTVSVAELLEDAVVEVPGTNADYALVISGAEPVPTTAPTEPSALTVLAVSHRAIIRYSDDSTNECGFEVERSVDGTNFTVVATAPKNSEEYVDTTVLPNTTYFYRVRAVNAFAPSAYTPTIRVRTIRARKL